MNKVDVTICTGADCNQTQATWLKQFDQIISPSLKSRINITCGSCERCCTSDRANAPRVRINDRVINRATPGQVRDALLKQQPIPLPLI